MIINSTSWFMGHYLFFIVAYLHHVSNTLSRQRRAMRMCGDDYFIPLGIRILIGLLRIARYGKDMGHGQE